VVVDAFLYSGNVYGMHLDSGVVISSCPSARFCETLGLTSGQEKSLLLPAMATPAGAVFLIGGVIMALTTLPHLEHRGKP
jgi:hypothetical protein